MVSREDKATQTLLFFVPQWYFSVSSFFYLLIKEIQRKNIRVTCVFGYKDSFKIFSREPHLGVRVTPYFLMPPYYKAITQRDIRRVAIIKDQLLKEKFDLAFLISWNDFYLRYEGDVRRQILKYFLHACFDRVACEKYVIQPSDMSSGVYRDKFIRKALYHEYPSYPFASYNHTTFFRLSSQERVASPNILKQKKALNIFLWHPDYSEPYSELQNKVFLYTLERFTETSRVNVHVYAIKNLFVSWTKRDTKYRFPVTILPGNISIEKMNEFLKGVDVTFTPNFWGVLWRRIILYGSIGVLFNDALDFKGFSVKWCARCKKSDALNCLRHVEVRESLHDSTPKGIALKYLAYIERLIKPFAADRRIKLAYTMLRERVTDKIVFVHLRQQIAYFRRFYASENHWQYYRIHNALDSNATISLFKELLIDKEISERYYSNLLRYKKIRDNLSTFADLYDTL